MDKVLIDLLIALVLVGAVLVIGIAANRGYDRAERYDNNNKKRK